MLTKFYRVAKSGKTIDGREITAAQIDQMAATYDPKKYGARVWLEHLRSVLPADTPFKAYGDVLAVKAEADPDGSRVLLAQIDATPELMKMAAERQKVFWSIEMIPNMAGSGQAYMAGLAVTDTPASLGTEMLKFSLQNRATLPGGDKIPDHLFSVSIEAAFEEDAAAARDADKGPNLFNRVKALVQGKSLNDDQRFKQIEDSTLEIAETVSGLRDTVAKFAGADAMRTEIDALRTDLAALKTKLGTTPDTPPRALHSGAPAAGTLTDC
jgi:hypothetical protein